MGFTSSDLLTILPKTNGTYLKLCALWPERPLDYEDVLQQPNDFDTENNDEKFVQTFEISSAGDSALTLKLGFQTILEDPGEMNYQAGISSNRTIIDLVKNLSASDTSIDGNAHGASTYVPAAVTPGNLRRAVYLLNAGQLVASRYVSGEKGLRFLIDHCPQLLDDLSAQTVVHLWKPKDPWRKSSERKPDPVSKVRLTKSHMIHVISLIVIRD
ncbi:hypothetical protein FGIG_11093 [Fasciola gigantica]|uniref:Uncharacterized protein n=1 Tax=Fasciola gigantica TaxID=46835 RepID=A0A504YBG7_FASGI|nr:hypothetical protein FGIG_11093 [Fasciola gigantica]